MSVIQQLTVSVKNDHQITKEEALALCHEPLNELCAAANNLRKHFCGNTVDLCTIMNGKSGKCSENCKYCAQSAHYNTNITEYPVLDTAAILKAAQYNEARGIVRFAVVTSGRTLAATELNSLCESYQTLRKNCSLSLCASHGLLTLPQLQQLKKAGVSRYHNNLETSRRFFPHICTTHAYDDKIRTIQNARLAGLDICSGGIIGLGETMEDRIDMAMELRKLRVKSVPLNVLNPIPGTPFANNAKLNQEEILRVISLFRFILPNSAVRLAGGRGLFDDKGRAAFESGANAAISGDMLTTAGISIQEDMSLLKELQFEVKML